MVLEPNFTRIASSVRKSIGTTQSVIELKLPTNEDMIDAIYSVSAKSSIVSSEVVGKEINFVGLIDYQAMYESQGVSAMDYSAEFKDKYTWDQEIVGEVILTTNVIDITSNIVSNGIRIVAIVETTIDLIATKDISVLTGVNGDNVFLSSKNMTINTYLGKAYEKFDVSGDLEIKGAEKILLANPSVCLTRVDPRDNYVNIAGVVNIDVYYQLGNEPEIRSKSDSIDFSWEVALEGINSDSYVQSAIDIVFNEIKVSTMLEDGNANINVYIPLMYNGYVFNNRSIDVVEDVYSSDNYLSITSENFPVIVGNESDTFRDTIIGTASIAETAPFIDDILSVNANNIVLASNNVCGDKLTVEGIAYVTVVYFTKETNAMTSVQIEMPFVVEQRAHGNKSSIVTLCLTNINARSRRGKEIEVSADLNVYADMYGEEENTVISNLVVGDEKQKDDCSLYIYIVKPNDTIWDIAKDMNVSTDLILEQNPDIELPLKVGERLVIYKPQILDF